MRRIPLTYSSVRSSGDEAWYPGEDLTVVSPQARGSTLHSFLYRWIPADGCVGVGGKRSYCYENWGSRIPRS